KVGPRLTVDVGMRASHFTMPYEANDQMASFDPSTADRALGNSSCNGLIFPPGTNPCPALGLAGGSAGQNRSLIPTKALLIAPRLGFAWDVSGTGKTSVRGGLGLFYARERTSPAQGMGLNPPFSGTDTAGRTLA